MRLALSAILIVAAPSFALAAAAPTPPPILVARLSAPVAVDGVLDEAVWQSTTPVTQFTQRDPSEGIPPSQRTEVRIAYDDNALYVSARLFDSAPDSILARLTRRDNCIPADRFIVYVDPFHDRRSGYYFSINAGGTLYDGTLSNDGAEDASWDAVWQGSARVDDRGWTAEMKIPFSQLRYSGGATPVWGINFARAIQRRNEWVFVVYQPKNESGFVSRFPDLAGLDNLPPARSIEILPYVTSKAEYTRHAAFDPFNDGSRYTGDAGGDLRAAIGSRLTLNATVNPDFGQVEVDPAVVNLSDVESFFEEKRPFFVEGISNFRFGNEGSNSYWNFNWPEPLFFYSRRIGRAPQGSVPDDADYVNAPLGTTILGAAKLTGKITPTWNFGTLHAITAAEDAKLMTSGVASHTEIEPFTYYGVARGLHEFKDRRYGFGLLANTVIRRFDDPRLESELSKHSVVTGFDGWAFLDPRKKWVISGWSAMSRVTGTAERMADLQRNSRHYFQRPDAPQVSFDPARTSLTGFGSRYWLNKQEGRTFMNAGLGFINPSFEVNDMGFQNQTDVINGHVAGGYKWTEPTQLRKYQEIATAAFGSWDFDGNMTWGGLFLNGNTEFINNYSWNYETAWNPQTVNDRRTRGGPQILNLPGYEFSTYFDTDGKKKLFYFVSASTYLQPEAGSYNWSVNPGIEVKPASNITLRVGPYYERNVEDAQYVTTADDTLGLAPATFGRRYVFAQLDQKTFAANIRCNWALTPNLSLQVFAQPLVSSGAYTGFKELARPRSYDFLRYGENGSTFNPSTGEADPDGAGPADPVEVGNPDFNFKSLRGNAVMRWEYMPGSTLYLVWTQERTDSEDLGDFQFRRSLSRLVDAPANNIFLAKVTYYFHP